MKSKYKTGRAQSGDLVTRTFCQRKQNGRHVEEECGGLELRRHSSPLLHLLCPSCFAQSHSSFFKFREQERKQASG